MDFHALQHVGALDGATYPAFVDWLKRHFAHHFHDARDDAQKVKHAIAGYLAYGERMGLTRGELVDFFCVDTPNILDLAGYSEAEADTAVVFFDEDPVEPAL
jgi:hypothetical protein